ncbi:MAG: ADP-ribosylglycohydrolase family protein [Eubacteriales bacterium]|nr:ADP-ribosylglycohydrolase family protein [Eubacteriales bacterium]
MAQGKKDPVQILQDKFYGCIAGVHIGSAMGAAVEGWTWQKIEAEHGLVDRFLPYEHYNNGWLREPGTTEDGVERQKHMITAIIEKQDRVTAEDVRAIWCRDIADTAPGTVSEPFEGRLLAMAKSGIPAADLGRYCDYAGLNSFARSCHPIALINAGDPQHAMEDVLAVGQLYQTDQSRGLKWASVTGVAVAAATRPNATVDSVIGTIFDLCDPDIVNAELERGLEQTRGCTDIRELRSVFDGLYSGIGMPYAFSFANEVVTKAVCAFRMVGGDTKQGIIAGVNMGRDTDCVAAVTAGICGALMGTASLPEEWIRQLDHATEVNPYTAVRKTMKEQADSLFKAYESRLMRQKLLADTMLGASTRPGEGGL